MKMSDYRLPKIYIYNWDISHGHSWAKELKSLIYLNDFKAKCSSCIKKREVCGYRVKYEQRFQTYGLINYRYTVEPYVKYNLNKWL